MKQLYAKILILVGLFLLIGSFFVFDLHQYLTFDYLKTRHIIYKQYYEQNPTLTLLGYSLAYLILTALSIPCLSVMILIGGALFGFPLALLIVSFADVFGSTLAFLSSRSLLGKYLQNRYPSRLRAVNHGFSREGGFYLFYLRMIPLFPCFLINLLMGLTKMRVATFYWVTQIGKFPHNALYVNAGTQLSKMDSFSGAFSPSIIVSFLLIGFFPLLMKVGLRWVKMRKTVYLPQKINL
ncbi:Uncharacterized membrane protein YdjX, TVP38/TMEM64 family, SNARE-associated domain [Desulfuromusa kysingii]|uniref:TVP38/TMEM64 family membrane protein n=1 Tax=Desulfuromusa kysingii TaxID=37625 RepID=A0A1H4E3M5_9BACT|nr:VTT domain-containing protein [Desulfuromusa kysingii]SEA79664.1 Uncharacterized membrane protein YdjX, TVP38/TMEM64 family, SNARE-associated domain [Desulfuromusa kysingii]